MRIGFDPGEYFYVCLRSPLRRAVATAIVSEHVLIRLQYQPARDTEDFCDQEEQWGWLLDQPEYDGEPEPQVTVTD